jgi:hypothetical protein
MSEVVIGKYNSYPYNWNILRGENKVLVIPLDAFETPYKVPGWFTPVPAIKDPELTARAKVGWELYRSQVQSRDDFYGKKPLIRSNKLRFRIRCFLTRIGVI